MNNIDNLKKIESNKQGTSYLSKIYSSERRPITSYPLKLAKHLTKNFIKIKKNKKLKLLDIACGRGDMLRSFKSINFDVCGIDLSEEAKKMCYPIKVKKIDMEKPNISFNNKKFDVIFSKSLIEHLKEPINFFNSCKKLLKDDGVLIVITPSWYHHKFGPFYLDFTHYTPFTLQSLRDIALLTEYKKINVDYFYQLPILWKFKFLTPISKLICFLKIPYLPMYEKLTFIKWPEPINKFIRHSNETMLIGIFKK